MICWNCGTKNTQLDNFCLDCGKLLNVITSDEQVDLNYNKIFNITRKPITSKEFTVTDNIQRKFTIQPKSYPKEKLIAVVGWGLSFVLSFVILLSGIFLTGLPVIFTNGFYSSVVIIGLNIGVYFPFILIPLIDNERFYTEIDDCVQDQIIGKVKPKGIRHYKWIFTNNKDGKTIKKLKMKFTSKTKGIINIENKNHYNTTYHFTRSEKGSPPEIDLYIDTTRVLRLIFGPEFEKNEWSQGDYHKTYERKDFQILARDGLNEDVVLFFATVISNKFKSRNNNPISKYFAPF